MSQTTKIVIADANEEFRTIISEMLGDAGGFEIVGATGDGVKAVELVRKTSPDIVLTDLILSGVDGLVLLEKISEMQEQIRPKVIVLSGFINNHVISAAQSCGAAFFIQKPCDLGYLLTRIKMLAQNCSNAEAANKYHYSQVLRGRSNTERFVTEIMHEIGIPANLRGYHYLRDAIMRTIENDGIVNAITKELYPIVAQKFNTTSSCVERAIRHAIEISWDRGDLDVLQKYFGYTVSCIKGKPTNSEFIAMIADTVRRDKNTLNSGWG